MKGVFIHEQLEYRIEVPLDDVSQGDGFVCTFTIKNHTAAPKKLDGLQLALACGDSKMRFGEKGSPAILRSAPLGPAWELAEQQQHSMSWPVTLDRNCVISEKSQTLFMSYGRISGMLNTLALTVKPHVYLRSIVEILESSFQFVPKAQRSVGGWVETKLKPPSARRLSLVNELLLGFRFEEDGIALRFRFTVKKFDTSANTMKVGKGVSEVEIKLAESALVRFGAIDHALVEKTIEEALQTVATPL